MTYLTVAQDLSSAISGIDLSGVMDGILSVVPIALPVVISFIGLRKGIAFLKSTVAGA